MDVKERIQQYIDSKGIKVNKFEESIGVSKSYWRKTNSISANVVSCIFGVYSDLSPVWAMTGKGEMLKSAPVNDNQSIVPAETRPRIPYTAAAGTLTSAVEGVSVDQCEQIPRIASLPNYDFTIIIKGNSMEPKYEGGDEVACKRIDDTSFIQWGKVHVLDTSQGIVIKRVYEEGDGIRCVSYNKEYPDFVIGKDEIYSMSLVVGLLRM